MAAVSGPALITSPPTQGKLLPYRRAVLLQHSSDKVPTTLLFFLLRGIGISMSIKAELVLGIFSHTPPSRPYRRSYVTGRELGRGRGALRTKGARRPERRPEPRPGSFRVFPSSEPPLLKCPITLLLFLISNSNTRSTAGGKEFSLVIKVMKYSFLLP